MRNGAVTLSGYVFLSVLDIYAFGGFRNPFAAEVIDEIIGGTGILRRNLLDGSGWGVDAEDGGVDALRLNQYIHLLCRTDEVNLRLLAEVGARCAGDGLSADDIERQGHLDVDRVGRLVEGDDDDAVTFQVGSALESLVFGRCLLAACQHSRGTREMLGEMGIDIAARKDFPVLVSAGHHFLAIAYHSPSLIEIPIDVGIDSGEHTLGQFLGKDQFVAPYGSVVDALVVGIVVGFAVVACRFA